MTIACRPMKMAHFVPSGRPLVEDSELLSVRLLDCMVPKAIVSDSDTRFTGRLWKGLCHVLNSKQRESTAYRPQTDGESERTNQTAEQMFWCSLSGDDTKWARIVPRMELAYSSTQYSSFQRASLSYCKGSCRLSLSAKSYSYRPRPRPIC